MEGSSVLQLRKHSFSQCEAVRRCRGWSDGIDSINKAIEINPIYLTLTSILQGLGIGLVASQKAGTPVTIVDNSQGALDNGLKFAG